MSLQKLDISIRRGETVALPIRVESDTLAYKTITAVAQTAPVRITATAHGLTTGWRAAVMNVKGMVEINAEGNPPKDKDLSRVTVVTADAVEFNQINAAGFRAYQSGGQLVYYAPFDLTPFTAARMTVKDRVGGAVLLALTSAGGTLEIDAVNQAVWIKLDAAATAALTFDKGVFDIELVDNDGKVTALCSAESRFTVMPEVTT